MALLAIPALLVIGVLPAILQQTSVPEAPAVVESQEARVEAPVPVSPAPQERAADPVEPEPAPPSQPASSAEADAPAADAPAAAAPAAPATRSLNALEPDGRPARALDESPAYSPAFSAVGTAMFYHTNADGQSALMRADADSHGAVLRVTSVVDDDARNYHPRPSPDGTQIAFDSDREGERAVYIADADGQKVRRVSEEGFAAIPSWSPDGRTLAYVRAEPGRPRVWNLWLTDLASGESRRLTSHRVGQSWGASWFPDGRRIAYSHETRLVIHDLDNGAERAYQSPIKGRLVRTPAVSPDGHRIMFQVHRDGAWLMSVADGSMRKVLSDPTAEEYTWAPDGRRVAYHSRQSGAWGVWIMASH
ncbi:MAG: PD40 domain-containing protein [Acidobacteria bacterium]|nr:PD40 domain-containing protein [Acidobacteriota bacterium]